MNIFKELPRLGLLAHQQALQLLLDCRDPTTLKQIRASTERELLNQAGQELRAIDPEHHALLRQWVAELDLARCLESLLCCRNKKELRRIRCLFPVKILNAAGKQLKAINREQHGLIREWVRELNEDAELEGKPQLFTARAVSVIEEEGDLSEFLACFDAEILESADIEGADELCYQLSGPELGWYHLVSQGRQLIYAHESQIVEMTQENPGFWYLEPNFLVKPLRRGDFVLARARPEKLGTVKAAFSDSVKVLWASTQGLESLAVEEIQRISLTEPFGRGRRQEAEGRRKVFVEEPINFPILPGLAPNPLQAPS